jgi:hypothetical protein
VCCVCVAGMACIATVPSYGLIQPHQTLRPFQIITRLVVALSRFFRRI